MMSESLAIMPAPTHAEWDRLRALCDRAKLSPEQVDRLQKTWEAAANESSLVYLAGHLSTLALLLARWLGRGAADALTAANGTPLVIGPSPNSIQPPLGHWNGFVWHEMGAQHVVVVPAAGPADASLRSSLAGIGIADQVLIVSRLGQPLSSEERRLAASLAALAATARVVFLALPSEEGTEQERAELTAYGVAQMEKNGFKGRCLGAGVWYTEGDRPADSVLRLDDWLNARSDDIAAGRLAALRVALGELLTEIEKAPDRPPEVTLSTEETDDLTTRFAGHIHDLGRRLRDLANADEFTDTTACRAFIVETLRGWLDRTSLEGMLLDFVERVRPGLKIELPNQAEAAAQLVRYEPPPKALLGRSVLAPGLPRQLAVTAVAAAVGFAVVYVLGMAFFRNWFLILAANIGGTAAALAGFIAAKSIIPWSRDLSTPSKESATNTLPGWASAELKLTNWFNNRIRSETPTIRQECAALRSHFNFEDFRK